MSVTNIGLLSPAILDERLKREKDYWLEKLSGSIVAPGLPLDYPRPEAFSNEKHSTFLLIDQETQDKLRTICERKELLVFAVLVTALKICLYKYTGMEDVTIGTTIHERYKEVASLNKVLVLRDRVRGAMTVMKLLLDVKRTLSEAYSNQKYPYQRLLELLDAESSNSHEPLFNVAILMTNFNNREHLSQLKSDINLLFSMEENGITGVIESNSKLFALETVEIFGEHFKEVLRQLLNRPETPISELGLLSAAKKREFITEFNNSKSDFPLSRCLHQLFEAQARRSPDALALSCSASSSMLSYAELDLRSNQLAHYLRRSAVTTGSVVALLLDHSTETLVAILGVLKAGAAYLPLDAAHPPARLAFALSDANAALVLTQQALMERLSPALTAHLPADTALPPIFSLDTEWEKCAALPTDNPSSSEQSSEQSSASLAYLIYTSGSTGQPKAVMIQHRSLVNYICWAKEVYLPEGEDSAEESSFALYSSLAFDLTVTSLFVPLVSGQTLSIYPKQGPESPLLSVLEENRTVVLKLTPSHLSLLKELDNRHSRIKRLIVGGEALSTELARAVSESFAHEVEIYNEYGPTEATVGCMLYRFDPQTDDRAWVAIGRPAANTQVYLLDEQLAAVAENVTAELYIGGEGVALGYLDRPELTAQKFIADPYGRRAGARLYRTGDLARRLVTGEVEYLGRRDEQVKYHGHRVELQELRSALVMHPQVRDAVVVVRRDGQGREQLVGYYVSRQAIESGELREQMRERVIVETVPTQFVHLRRLPLTLNGKVNIEALPVAGEDNSRGGVGEGVRVEPRTEEEGKLVEIWREVLGRERVGIHDNFFELGGHSLLATQLISRVRESFQVELPLRMLFAIPTVAELAERLEIIAHTAQSLQNTPAPIRRYARDSAIKLSFAQKRLWFLYQWEPASTTYNIAAAMWLTGKLDLAGLERTFSEIIRRHEALRTTFALVEGEPVQVIAEAAPVALRLTDLSTLPPSDWPAETQRRAAAEAHLPFDLAVGPLLRTQVLRFSESEHVLLLTMHHIVSDGWSIGVLIREVAALYEAYAQGAESPLEELPIQYADFSHWQREWLRGEVLEKELTYWRGTLAGAPTVTNLPTDRPRSTNTAYHGAKHSLEIPLGLTEALKQLGQRKDATLFMMLQTVFLSLLHYHTREVDLVVGTDVANRNWAEVEGLIGFFANQLVLRTNLRGDPTFEELLGRVRDVALGAYAHQHLPFDTLVEELNPERSLLYSPLFQVKLVLQNAPLPPMKLSGLTLTLLDVENETAKFDLMFSFREVAEGLTCNVEYSTKLFDARTVARFARGFVNILSHVVEHPAARLSELSKLLAESDSQQQSMLQEEFKGMRRRKLKNVVPKPIVSPTIDG